MLQTALNDAVRWGLVQRLLTARRDLVPPGHTTSAFGCALKAAGLPKIRLHDLRHTHATLLLRAGVNAKVVSERLGHSSVAFTLDTYSHVMPGMQPEVAEPFMNLVLGEDEADDEASRRMLMELRDQIADLQGTLDCLHTCADLRKRLERAKGIEPSPPAWKIGSRAG